MKDKVWNALRNAKLGVEYTALYSLKVKNRRNLYKKITLLTAFAGMVVFIFWQPAALIACIIIFLGELLVKFTSRIILSDNDLLKLGDLKIRYVQLFNKLERLMIDINDDCLPQDEVNKLYSQILNNKIEIEHLEQDITLPHNQTFKAQAEQLTDAYLTDHFES